MGKRIWPGVGECVGESAGGADGGISRGAFRYVTIVGKKFNSVDDAFSSGLRDVYSVAPILFRGAANVPSRDAMGCPCAENSRGLKDKDCCDGRGKGCEIEGKCPIELVFR